MGHEIQTLFDDEPFRVEAVETHEGQLELVEVVRRSGEVAMHHSGQVIDLE